LLNYGRIENNVRVEDAQFQALIGLYENTVLTAQSEVENAIAGYLSAQREGVLLKESVTAATRAVEVADTQYRGGTADYTRVLNTQQSLQQEQSRLVSTRGAVALNLVSLYRSLGGGWELRGDHVQIDQKIQEQMRQRTDWDRMLPATQPAK
jgi:outer membrane protein TolC